MPSDAAHNHRYIKLALGIAVVLGTVVAAYLHLLVPMDQPLQEARFGLTNRDPSGETVFVEIDAQSLAAIGVWPWPRQVHAQVLDRLMKLGAAEVVFDVDFSTTSNAADDAEFERSLRNAGGYALLAAFQQVGQDGTIFLNTPLNRFAVHSEPVLVNVDGDGTGLLHSVPAALPDRGLRSVALALAPGAADPGNSIAIDYGIDLNRIDRLSVDHLLNGAPDATRIANKQVIVGASAVELRDFFRVPRFGVIPGPLVQLAATETLKANRPLHNLGHVPAALAALLVVLISALSSKRLSLRQQALGAVLGMIGVEGAAWLALGAGQFLVETAVFHVAAALLVLAGLVNEHAANWRRIQRQQARLAHLATHETVTDALSRHAFVDQIESQLASGPATVVLVQLEGLDATIAALGHDLGDAIAVEAVGRLEMLLATKPARIASDVFGWSLPDLLDHDDLMRACHSASQRLNQPYAISGTSVVIDTRIGASQGQAGTLAAELLRQAEVALIQAQADGISALIYEPEQSERIRSRRLRDVALRQALARNEFFLLYQPQIDLSTGRTYGAEALVRWRSEELGLVSPADFIPLAEETGLIVPLGAWIMMEACRQAVTWGGQARLSVNVSSVQFRMSDVATTVHDVLRTTGFPAHRLDLEVTESLLMGDDPKVISALEAIRAMGVSIALDDFGTGYSSLSYLSRLPLDKLKIDQSFVRPLPDPHSEAIVETIVLMAKRLGKTIVAEGIETVEQRDYLTGLGCEYGQGYLFGRPSEPAQLGFSSGQAQAA